MKQCEICHEYHHLDKHHIQSRVYGGSNKKNNIATICPNCHRKVHLGEIILEGKFLTTNGYMLFYHLKDEPSITNHEPKVFLINT